jgi:hypothetical protein
MNIFKWIEQVVITETIDWINEDIFDTKND